MNTFLSNISKALFVCFIGFSLSSCYLIEETGSSGSSTTTEKPKPKTTVDKDTKVTPGPSKSGPSGSGKQTKDPKKK